MQTETLTPATDARSRGWFDAAGRADAGLHVGPSSGARQLQRMKAMLGATADFLDALAADLGKPRLEAWATDIAIVINEIDCLRHLAGWMKPERVWTPWRSARAEPPSTPSLSAWYWSSHRGTTRCTCARLPMVGRWQPATRSSASRRGVGPHLGGSGALLPEYLDPKVSRSSRVASPRRGAARRTVRPHLLHRQRTRRPDRHGGGREHLTPVTLELGGKSP